MKYLLDTCVLSEIRNPNGNISVKQAVLNVPSKDLFLSVISISEIAKGVALLEEGQRKHVLTLWLQGLICDFSDRVLPVDGDVATLWGDLTATCRKKGKPLPAGDGLIAATAMQHGLSVMTRNIADFEATGAMTLNPWNSR